MTLSAHPQVRALIAHIDAAVADNGPQAICAKVKAALAELTQRDPSFLPEGLLQPAPNHYARRLLHRDPKNRYSIVVMAWAPGQGTPLHDHAGQWCVEGVYRGKIRVRSYALTERQGDLCRFEQQDEVVSGVGQAGWLIPPYEHHVLENPFEQLAVTIHVYSQELTWCHAFIPAPDGRYRRERKTLGYTN